MKFVMLIMQFLLLLKFNDGDHMRYNKYNNQKFFVDGIQFDSKKEGLRYRDLKLMEKSGLIVELELQPKFELIPTQKKFGKTYKKVSYVADFAYFDVIEKKYIVEDVKGYRTPDFNIKEKLFILKYDLELKII